MSPALSSPASPLTPPPSEPSDPSGPSNQRAGFTAESTPSGLKPESFAAELTDLETTPIGSARHDSQPGRLSTQPSPHRLGSLDTTADHISVLPLADLSPAELERWEQIRSTRDEFAPPFFASRFAAAVNSVRGDVWVAVFRSSNDDPIGFFPFHRIRGVGLPVGRFLNDAQNVIAARELSVDWSELAKAAQVRAFDLHAIVGGAPEWIDRYHLQTTKAFRADLGSDSESYLRNLQKEHRTIAKQGQKTRKLAREVGPIRLELDCRCPDILKQTIQWKRDQYQRTHILDLFLPDWTRQLIQTLYENELSLDGIPENSPLSEHFANDSLRGICSVLWAGDRPVATHIGTIERGRLHYWFPTYDPSFSKYSPGTALFTEIIRNASSHGIHCVDMGYGEQPYKQKQTATTTTVAHGTITDSRWHRFAFHAEATMVQALKRVPMKETVKRAIRTINPAAGIRKLK
ncbi:GNAT family N-acetyltransferase [Rhodopirellula sp. JC740]|uniref:GNAT family N-acetyltransferase n=1 Tax=Rhodopirellula halodulae TaxID=2894198 RepID=A0ABS8ND27_9BACT|nr:GNAT family N-acetyltransferase [Rhodopirellula sp. JC740]MCC9641453.1 GNAT family N-acetyltransferase [Rhodopirellula sp. JC740]